MIKIIILLAIALLLLTSCAGKITVAECGSGFPGKTTEIYFVIAPSPMPIDARPPQFQPVKM